MDQMSSGEDLSTDTVDELWADGFAMEKYLAEKEWDIQREKFEEEFTEKFDKIGRELATQFRQKRLKLVNGSMKHKRELLEQLFDQRTKQLDEQLEETHKLLQNKLYENWNEEKMRTKNQFKKQIARFEILDKEKSRARELSMIKELDQERQRLESDWHQRFIAAFHSWDTYLKKDMEPDINHEWETMKNKAIYIFRDSLDKVLKDFARDQNEQEIVFQEQAAYLTESIMSQFDTLRWKTLSFLEHSNTHAKGEFEIERVDKLRDFLSVNIVNSRETPNVKSLKNWEQAKMQDLAKLAIERESKPQQ